MAKSKLINSLFKIDAAEGFVRYTNAVKPYHSKILDILIEYVYKEDIRVKVREDWKIDIGTYDPEIGVFSPGQTLGQSCYFSIINSETIAGNNGVWTIEGHHQEKFKAGERILVTYEDGSSKVFIIERAENSEIVQKTDPYRTAVTVIDGQTVPNKLATSIQLAFTPDYRIVGAVTGLHGAWIVDGDVRDEFQVGERVIVANTKPNNLGSAVYTIAEPPRQGYVPGVEVGGVESSDNTPDYNIVAVIPSRLELSSGDWVVQPGQWIILGPHADKLVPGSHFSVTENFHNKYYVIDSVVETVYNQLNPQTTIQPDNVDFLESEVVTVITVRSTQEIPPDARPSGVLQCPIIPAYEIIDKTPTAWVIAGQYGERFQAGDRLFVADNQDYHSNGEYVIASAITTSSAPYTTTVEVEGGLPPSATISGIIQHPTKLTTIIPVSESVFENETSPDVFYKAFGTGTLRHLPTVFYQPCEPVNTVLGAIWVNPITNVSKRWGYDWDPTTRTWSTDLQWIHNYTPTNYSWFELFASERDQPYPEWAVEYDAVTPRQLVVQSSVGQIDNQNDSLYGKSNSFLVDITGLTYSTTFTAISTKSNQMIFSTPCNIIGVDSFANKWIVDGIVDVSAEETIYVSGSTSPTGTGRYVVASVTHTAATTEIYVTKQISRLATPDGILSIPTAETSLPKWVEGTAVRVVATSPNVAPTPLTTENTYYFIPITPPTYKKNQELQHWCLGGDPDLFVETPAVFALSKVRNPHCYEDFVDITTLGSGTLSLVQAELYVPGTKINIRDSYMSRNNGSYTITRTVNETPTLTRVYVAERVQSTTPATASNDGVMMYDLDSHVYSTLTERACKTSEQSGMFADARITEYIEFVFIVDDFDLIQSTARENEPYTGFVHDYGYDVMANDTTGFDGDLVLANSMSTSSSATTTFSHHMIPIGFDTQYFDVGGLDESTTTVAKKYGLTV
jgi:hypothetical protein